MNIEVKGEEVFIDGEKYVREPKPEAPEVEYRRLYYIDSFRCRAQRVIDTRNWIGDFKPVHRRWNELTEEERLIFIGRLRNQFEVTADRFDIGLIFSHAIMITSGED